MCLADGAIVERGKPHLVQDAAIQVFTAGRHLRSILSSERQINEIYEKERQNGVRRRLRQQSWFDINEYQSVPYYQYTNILHLGIEQSIQCDLDQSIHFSQEKSLSSYEEEQTEEIPYHIDFPHSTKKDQVQTRIHPDSPPKERVQISMMTQTE